LTNTTRSPKSGILARLHGMGVTIGEDELFTPAWAACDYLAANDLAAHLLIHPNLAEEFAGLSGRGDEDRIDPKPTAVVDDLAAAVAWITTHQGS
jgi:ribonucleotide monophosphatase NagD (HAD superfamily)